MRNIPYCLIPPPFVQGVAVTFSAMGNVLSKNFPELDEQLEHAGMHHAARDYLAVCFASNIVLFILFGFIIGLPLALPLGFLLSFFLTVFVAMQQVTFPRVVTIRRVGRIEKHLLPALQDMRVQINAGIPMYSVLSNIAHADYGDVSIEFGKAVDRIGAGEEQLHVMQSIADANPSIFFRRAIMQISNGMHAG